MPASHKTPLKLLPAIAAGARQKARQVNMPLSSYVSILLWNHAQNPIPGIEREPDSPDFGRVHVPCSIRSRTWSAVKPHIDRSRLPANAFIEALIGRDLRSG